MIKRFPQSDNHVLMANKWTYIFGCNFDLIEEYLIM